MLKNKNGSLAIDALLAMVIILFTITIVSSSYYANLNFRLENIRTLQLIETMENHLEDLLGRSDWDELAQEPLTPNITVSYDLTETDYGTYQLDVIFTAYGKSYPYIIEKAIGKTLESQS